ncbi:MAG: cadherin-like domain-containing protein, partial [Betaproteobacteria bacterium]|nr:cadherin-like domain-containing protein [Betaproteobacteria bacterium]
MHSSLTALSDGGFVASWQSFNQDGSGEGVYAQRYDAQDQAVGGEFRVNAYTTYAQYDPSLTALPDGGFVASWESYDQDGSGYGVYAQRYDAQSQMVGGEFRINTHITSDQYAPSLTTLSDGGFVASWHSYSQDGSDFGVYAQRYNAQSQAVGGEFRVNTHTADGQSAPSLTALSDGGFVASWHSYGQDGSGFGVYAQRYDAQSQAVSGEFRVNTYTAGDQVHPSLTALLGGGFVASWYSYGQDGSGNGVYAQRYDAKGQAAGGEFRVNTYTTDSQRYPILTALSDGGFVASWTSSGQDGSDYGVYAQRYDAQGQVVGGEFRIHTYTSGSPWDSSLTTLSDGSFVVSWESLDQDGSHYNVYARRYGIANVVPTGDPGPLPDGQEDVPYLLTTAALIAGITDADGDLMAVLNLTANHGTLSDNGNFTWTFTPDA